MLDVHVLLSADTPPEWIAQCRSSIAEAVDTAGYPVSVFYLPGVDGHIGRGRAAGFEQGGAPFVTYVDDDDYVLPGAFRALAPVLTVRTRLAFTRERREQNGQWAGYDDAHHLAVIPRTDAVAHNWQDYPAGGEGELYRTLGAPELIPVVAYVHRLYESKGRALRNV